MIVEGIGWNVGTVEPEVKGLEFGDCGLIRFGAGLDGQHGLFVVSVFQDAGIDGRG